MQRLDQGPVIGDGGYVFEMEWRGWVYAGPWTTEVNVSEPMAVQMLHKEFARAGADVIQAFTFYSSEDKIQTNKGVKFSAEEINRAACKNAFAVKTEMMEKNNHSLMVAGGLSQTPAYLQGLGREAVVNAVEPQLRVFQEEDVDFMMVEYYEHLEECVWHIEACKKVMPNKSVVACLAIGPNGDINGTTPEECAKRMLDAGADVIGHNCHFDPDTSLKVIERMQNGLITGGYKNCHMCSQPLAFHTPEKCHQGFIALPEFPYALETRFLNREEAKQFARKAYEMGVRYIGGCCGFRPYHIRAMAEELYEERSHRLPISSLN